MFSNKIIVTDTGELVCLSRYIIPEMEYLDSKKSSAN